MKRKLFVLALAIIMAVSALSACAPAAEGDAVPVSGSGSPTMDRILEEGVIKVGIALNGPPIGFRDDSGTPMGYDVDFAYKLAEVLGVEVEFVDVNGETRIPTLTSGRVDVVFANMTGNLERAKTIDFSIPYLESGIKMLTAAGSQYTSLDMLDSPDVRIAVARGTTGEALVLKHAPSAELVYVQDFTDQILQLEQGKADVTFEDSSLVDYAAMTNDALEAQTERYSSDPICIGVAKGDMEFVRYLDMFVSWQISQGFQAETYEKWWGVPPAPMTSLW